MDFKAVVIKPMDEGEEIELAYQVDKASVSDVSVVVDTGKDIGNEDEVTLVSGHQHSQGAVKLAKEIFPGVSLASVGLVGAGYVLNSVQHTPVFTEV